jgi:hypothetical protein
MSVNPARDTGVIGLLSFIAGIAIMGLVAWIVEAIW